MNSVRVWLNGQKQAMHKSTVFSGGEVHVNVASYPDKCDSVLVKARITNSEGLIETLLLCEALWARYPKATKQITLPYMPYSRQDRRCATGDAFSLQIIAKTIYKGIADLGFELITWDMHSREGLGIISNQLSTLGGSMCVQELSMLHLASSLERYGLLNSTILVSPDKGARAKVSIIGEKYNIPVVYGSKLRDPKTGNLSGFSVDMENLNGLDVLIVDDICDGGGTFLGLAEELKKVNCGKISLYVTHGIFSKGFDIFSGIIDNLYTTTSIPREVQDGEVAKGVFLTTLNI